MITGPTASGKSALAYRLAEQFDIDVINLDSAQVYRDLDIGTAKPSRQQQLKVPHHLIDIREPSQPYTAFEFCKDARAALVKIQGSGRTPVFVGGTMLYLKALREGIAEMPAADPDVRAEILRQAELKGWPEMHERLKRVDPVAAARIKSTDRQRLQRALEVHELTGKTLSDFHAMGHQGLSSDLLEVAIVPTDRSELHQKIAQRFNDMLEMGLVKEVERLRQSYRLEPSLPSMKAVGYRQVWQYLEGEIDHATMRDKAIIATRQLAKRQYTWLRSFAKIKILSQSSLDELLKIEGVDTILRSG